MSWCPQPLVWPCSSTRPMPRYRGHIEDVEAAARAMGLQIQVLNAGTSREIDAAFATFVRERPDALFVGTDPFLHEPARPIGQLAARHAIPAVISGSA